MATNMILLIVASALVLSTNAIRSLDSMKSQSDEHMKFVRHPILPPFFGGHGLGRPAFGVGPVIGFGPFGGVVGGAGPNNGGGLGFGTGTGTDNGSGLGFGTGSGTEIGSGSNFGSSIGGGGFGSGNVGGGFGFNGDSNGGDGSFASGQAKASLGNQKP
ncbi:glycine-rich protein 5 [Solanum pennellii]|uniref:Glycine-rich protein 5 n=1 Tax=Solanum pennellii TaxID=28526 RepID=A0ABM1G2Z8_SOLPN|nr:glycine-rich protein 5 [Solanum pennellii]